MRMNKTERRCILLSVLCSFWDVSRNLRKKGDIFPSSSQVAFFIFPTKQIQTMMNKTCVKSRKKSLHQRKKSRYQSASLTVEASVAFPVFFFAVLYLIQMFSVLRAEVAIAEAGITAAREIAAYSYAAERLAEGETVQAEKLLELFDQKIVRDASLTALFYAKCDQRILEQGKVARGLGGIWVNTEEDGERVRASIQYRVTPANVWKQEKGRYYTMHIVYRPWTGEGKPGGTGSPEQAQDTGIVYVTKYGTVYHLDRNCSYIKKDIQEIQADRLEDERNASGAKYYPCEFCLPDGSGSVYITDYGTRYHRISSCSAVYHEIMEISLEKIKDTHGSCSKCGMKTEEGS